MLWLWLCSGCVYGRACVVVFDVVMCVVVVVVDMLWMCCDRVVLCCGCCCYILHFGSVWVVHVVVLWLLLFWVVL